MTARVAIFLKDESAQLYSRLINKKHFIEYALKTISQDPALERVFFKARSDSENKSSETATQKQKATSKTTQDIKANTLQW